MKCRRKESCFRVKLRNRWVRVGTQRQLVVVRKEKVGCSFLLEGMLRKCRLFWHVFLGMFGMFGMLVHVCERGNDEQPRPAKAEVSEHRLRALHRGLPLPGAGTSADPLNLDPVDPYDPEGLLEPPAGLPEGRRPPPQPERIVDPSGDPEDPGDETEDLRVPLSSFSLHRHRCNGHFPSDENCMACCSSKGRVPARRLRRKLQRENQTVGLDLFFFGKLRVLLVMHLGSRYTLCLPAPELNDDLAFNITPALKECGLTGKAVTFRLDNEASLVALVERTARHRACPASAVITDVVPGYRPQSKGSIEKQVDIMKSGFWAIWLDLEAQINQAQPSSDAPEGIKLPLGGLLWQACIFYTARCFNLWSSAPGNSSVSLDRLHEEYVQKTRTRALGSVCQARVARSKSHLQRYRGARTVKIVYLGPVHARGGGVYGVPLNGKDIDVFPAVAVGKEEAAIDVPTLLGLAKLFCVRARGLAPARSRSEIDPLECQLDQYFYRGIRLVAIVHLPTYCIGAAATYSGEARTTTVRNLIRLCLEKTLCCKIIIFAEILQIFCRRRGRVDCRIFAEFLQMEFWIAEFLQKFWRFFADRRNTQCAAIFTQF